jgi:biotin synthase-related radical SAM superfamily protein
MSHRYLVPMGQAEAVMERKIRASIGSLGVLGLRNIKLPAPPTTLYLMIGEKCMYNCAYCPQSQSSHGSTEFLSRVIWPKTDWKELKSAVRNAPEIVKRICFQVVNSKHFFEDTLFFVKDIKSASNLPVSVSVRLTRLEEIEMIFEAGAQRIGLALDVATESTFAEYRGGNFQKTVSLILEAGKRFPNKITTHIIVGTGETDKELYKLMNKFFANTVTVGLFAFTPIKGTRLENRKPPSLLRYRRIQFMRYLFAAKINFEAEFSEKGELISVKGNNINNALKNASIFVTSGCPNCNRPYYNEEPLGPMFNYPFPPEDVNPIL